MMASLSMEETRVSEHKPFSGTEWQKVASSRTDTDLTAKACDPKPPFAAFDVQTWEAAAHRSKDATFLRRLLLIIDSAIYNRHHALSDGA